MLSLFSAYKIYFYLGIVLVIVAAFAISNLKSYERGKEVAQGEMALAQQKAVEDALAKAAAQAKIDQAAAVAAETNRQNFRVAAQSRRNALENDIRQNPSDCKLGDSSFKLLLSAVRATNTATTTGSTSGGDGSVQPDP